MTYPAGVQLSTLTFSNPTTFLGNQATRTEVTVQASAGVVWAATGEPIDDFSETVSPNAGLPGFLTVPFVDQPGFTDQSGNAFTMWAYTVTRRTFFGSSMKVVQKNWQPVVGQDTVDFDNLPGGDIGIPVSAPIVPVTSVAGETGVVGAEPLADALAEFLPIPDVSGKLDASQKGAASGVAPLDSASAVPDANLPARLQDGAITTKVNDKVNVAVPPAVSAYIANDPSVVNSAATMAQSNTGLLPRWKASTAYAAGQQVAAPDGETVSAKVAFTSGATYNAANWSPSAIGTRVGASEAKATEQETRLPKPFEGTNSWQVRDKTGKVALGVGQDGSTKIGKTPIRSLPDASPYVYLVRDTAGKVAFGVRKDGTVTSGGAGSTVTEWHAFIAAGQSNMSGRGTPYGSEFDLVNTRIKEYGALRNVTGTITTAGVPLDMHDAPGGLSPATVFAREYLKTQPSNVGVLLIPAAHGGTGFYTSSETPLPAGYGAPNAGGGTWQYNRSEPVNLYQLMVAQTTAALAASTTQLGVTATLKGFLWHQGEGDTTATDQAGYSALFDAMIGDLRSRFGATLPVVLGEMSPDWMLMGTTAPKLAIRAAHVSAPARLTRTGFAKAVPDTGKYQDEIHFARAGVEALGANYVGAYKVALANTATSSPMPPRNTRATFIGGVLSVEWDYPICRATAFVVEYSIDGGAWTTITRATPADFKETKTGLGGSVAKVRVSTVNDVGTSAPSTPITALGA